MKNQIPATTQEYSKYWRNYKSKIKICSEDKAYPVLTPDWEPEKKRRKASPGEGNSGMRKTNCKLSNKIKEKELL